MAKRKTKTGTTKGASNTSKADLGTLVGTQRAVIEQAGTKHALAELAVKLLAQHGTDEQKALTCADIERKTKDEIVAGVVALAVRGQAGKKVRHLSELGGWPVCWSDEQRAAIASEELLATPIAVTADAVTCAKCKKAADLPSPEETAALERVETAAGEAGKPKKKADPVTEGEAKAARAKRQLVLKENLAVRLKIKELEVKGVVRPNGSMSVRGVSYASPHEAANELAGELVNYRIDGFQAWRFEDANGKWRMLRDHA